MNDLVMLEAALFQLRTAVALLDDDFYASQIKLAVNVLAGAIQGAGEPLSAASVSAIEFALNDLAGLVGELDSTQTAGIDPILIMLVEDVARLKQSTALSPEIVQAITTLRTKLKARSAAIERETYRDPSSPSQPLPHPPEELRADAEPLRAQLAGAGFATPALDTLVTDPSSLRFHTINEIVDELDVIAG
jgi:hypothetical protein